MRIPAIAGLLSLFWLWLTWPPSREYQQGVAMRCSRIAAGVVVVAVLALAAAGCTSATAHNPIGVISPTTTTRAAPPMSRHVPALSPTTSTTRRTP